MMSIDDILALAERGGQFDEAIQRVPELYDPVEQIRALTKIALIMAEKGLGEWVWDVIEDAEYIAENSKESYVKSLGYALIGAALFKLGGDQDGAEEYLDMALEEASGIEDPLEKGGEVVAEIARSVAMTGDLDGAMELFDEAFDLIARAEIDYRTKVDELIKIGGEIIEKTGGDDLPSRTAREFYRIAFDIFDKLRVNQRAAIVEKKLLLTKTVENVGLPEIRKALLEGRYHYALALIRRKFEGVKVLMGQLEVALWMKMVNDPPEYIDLTNQTLSELQNTEVLPPSNAYSIALILTELEYLREALYFVRLIDDQVKRDEALRKIALAFSEQGEFEAARKVAGAISDPILRTQTLRDIEAIEIG
ncbi:hypothetical protein [Thermococcus sp. JCM 11816]|uniref:hypothetical protein n=1 Tax=Thermococcus sp. (strain JCM 11816 / KS-1) TaxID=1295125 RepID=UPI0006D2A5D4